jgi:hypothetical protein
MTEAYDENLILAYVEGDLPPAEQRDFKLTLMKDPKLRRLVEQMAEDRQALRGMPDEDAPPDLMEAIDLHLERQMLLSPSAAQPIVSPDDHRRFKLVRVGSFAAMAAMLLLGVGLMYQTLRDMESPPPAGSPGSPGFPGSPSASRVAQRQLAAEMDGDAERKADEPAGPPLAMAPQQERRREAPPEDLTGKRDLDGRMGLDLPSAAPTAPAPTLTPADEPTLTETATETEQPAAQSMAKIAVIEDIASPPATIIENQTMSQARPATDAVAPLPQANEASGIVGGMGTVASATPPGVPSVPPGAMAPPAPSAYSLFGSTAALATQPPRNLAIIVTAHDPTKAYQSLLAWCERHHASIRFDSRRNQDADDVAELFAAGERKRVAVTFDAELFPRLLDLFQGSPRMESTLVREPRGLRNRSMDSIDFADLIYRATVVDPASLELPPESKMTLQVVIRSPWMNHAPERFEPDARD